MVGEDEGTTTSGDTVCQAFHQLKQNLSQGAGVVAGVGVGVWSLNIRGREQERHSTQPNIIIRLVKRSAQLQIYKRSRHHLLPFLAVQSVPSRGNKYIKIYQFAMIIAHSGDLCFSMRLDRRYFRIMIPQETIPASPNMLSAMIRRHCSTSAPQLHPPHLPQS